MISAGPKKKKKRKSFGITNFLGRCVKLAAPRWWCSEGSNGAIKIQPMLSKFSLTCWVAEGDVNPQSSKNGAQLMHNNATWRYNFSFCQEGSVTDCSSAIVSRTPTQLPCLILLKNTKDGLGGCFLLIFSLWIMSRPEIRSWFFQSDLRPHLSLTSTSASKHRTGVREECCQRVLHSAAGTHIQRLKQ